ncbi:hypothetical protein HYDPIDRAFT_26585 [Hydnomerulius pinastri MD-312]|nr:hypothetical protein HYDPIDRAFT_26585 [Hydnomerulius pinastri MD-312]
MTQEIRFNSFGIPYIVEFGNVSFVPPKQCNADVSRSKHARHDPLSPAVSSVSEPTLTYSSASPSPSSSTSSFCYIPDRPSQPPRFPSLTRSFSLRSASSIFRRKSRPSLSDTSTLTTPTPSQSTNVSDNVLPTWSSIPSHAKPLPPPPPPQAPGARADGLYIQFSSAQSCPQMSRKDELVHLQKTISSAVLEAGMDTPPSSTDCRGPSDVGHASQRSRGHKTSDTLYCGTYGQMMAALEGAGLSATPCLEAGFSGGTRLGALFVARPSGASGVQLRKLTLWG